MISRKPHLFFALLIILATIFISTNVSAEVGDLTNDQAKQLMAENVPVIDIRRPDEWQSTGVIKGSHLLTFFDRKGHYDMEKWLAELDKIAGKNDKFILVCRSGNRTGQVSAFLDRKLGYKKVYHLKNGITKWIRAGDKIVAAKMPH